MGDFYAPEYACGYRYDDPAFGIKWPLTVSEISDKDLAWSSFENVTNPQENITVTA